jgi:hypothetical protein
VSGPVSTRKVCCVFKLLSNVHRSKAGDLQRKLRTLVFHSSPSIAFACLLVLVSRLAAIPDAMNGRTQNVSA